MDKSAIHRLLHDYGRRANNSSHMSGHMVRLFEEVLAFKPGLIVDLGVGKWATSSRAMGMAAELCGARIIAVDLLSSERLYGYVEFVQADDEEYARKWDAGSVIDILMIDTSHRYEHTQREVEAWLPHLRPRCEIIFHDTNAKPHFEAVARFLRDWLSIPFPEGERFDVLSGDWLVRHYPESWGLTILLREALNG